MGISDVNPDAHGRRPWNAGNMVGAKRPLKPRDVWAIRIFLDEHRRLRDRALFDLAIDSKLRGCDIVKMKIGDIAVGGAIRNRATVTRRVAKPAQTSALQTSQPIRTHSFFFSGATFALACSACLRRLNTLAMYD